MSSCKEINKLVGVANFLAWKKRTGLNLKEQEVIEHVKKKIVVPTNTQELAKYNNNEVRAKKILIESINDFLIPYVAKLETTKEIYDKLIDLFSVSTAGEWISLRNELYKMKINKGEHIAPYFIRVSEIKDSLCSTN